MKNTNKFLILLINVLMIISLSACSSASITDNGTIDATTNLSWDNDKQSIVVSTVTIKCNDSYYGVLVNDSINFNNDNNYFTTGNGLLIQITDNDELVSNNYTYSYKATIEDNTTLYVSGNDEDKIKEVFNGVYKTNKESYQMFSHDISDDWINNVVITNDVVSFSNGTDTTYIYQNEGSLSEGCLDGKIEPTVFKKQLRGIDIPITYPENIEGVSNYIPYGTKTYEHWTNEGYTPYSAYTPLNFTEEEYELVTGKKMTRILDDSEKMANFIILANNDENVLNLFEEKNDHTQNLYSLIPTNKSIESTLKTNEENLSSIREIASSVINSDNRYHFGILSKKDTYLKQWTESNKNGYYIDGNEYSNLNIAGAMTGKFVAPTVKISTPIYSPDSKATGGDNATLAKYGTVVTDNGSKEQRGFDSLYNYTYSLEVEEKDTGALGFLGHGAACSPDSVLKNDITSLQNYNGSNSWLMNQYYIMEGDYIYYYSVNGELNIFENISTEILIGSTDGYPAIDQTFLTNTLAYKHDAKYTTSESCFAGGWNNLSQIYKTVSTLEYSH